MAKGLAEWDQLAKELGYKDWEDCLTQLYGEMSVQQISKRIGVSTTMIINYLQKFDIKTRKRGGPHGGFGAQKRKLFLMDQRLIMSLKLSQLAKITGASTSTVYHYRRDLEGANGVLHNQSGEGAKPIFDTVEDTSDPAAGEEQGVQGVLSREAAAGGSAHTG